MGKETLYLYIDESGDFDFSGKHTRHLILTCLITKNPFVAQDSLSRLKYALLDDGKDVEFFHAHNDSWPVRNQVLSNIINSLSNYRVYSVIANKNIVPQKLRNTREFYGFFFVHLLQYLSVKIKLGKNVELVLITDRLPVARKRKAVTKAIKINAKSILGKRCHVYHHQSKADYNLQIVDYFGWAIFRKWERNDTSFYEKLASAINDQGLMGIFVP